MVLVGVNAWSYPLSVNIRDAINHARSVGFEVFEPVVDESDVNSLNSPEFNRKWVEVRDALSSAGLSARTVATGLYWRFNMIIREDYDKVLRIFEAEAKAANVIGARVLLVVPGVALPELSYEEHIERAREALAKLSRVAEDYGVVIGVENVWNRLFASPLDMVKLLEGLDPKVVGVYLDVGNTLPHSLPEHWLRALRGRIVAIHAKDFLAEPGRCIFGIPYTGSVNWGNVRKIISEIGYEGTVVAEVPPYPGDPFKAAEDAASSLRRIFK